MRNKWLIYCLYLNYKYILYNYIKFNEIKKTCEFKLKPDEKNNIIDGYENTPEEETEEDATGETDEEEPATPAPEPAQTPEPAPEAAQTPNAQINLNLRNNDDSNLKQVDEKTKLKREAFNQRRRQQRLLKKQQEAETEAEEFNKKFIIKL